MGYEFDWSVLLTYKGLLIQGLITTIKLSFIGIFLSFIIGSLVGIGRASKNFWLSLFASYYVESFRNIPLIVQMFFIYFTFTLSQIFPFLNTWGEFLHINDVDAFFSALLALTLYTGSYIAEVIKAGINSIPKGQFEAAKTLGLTSTQTFILIILPQAYRKMIPAFVSQFVALFKDTSLVYTIGVIEFFRAATIINNRLYLSFEIFSFVAFVYFCIAFSMSKFSHMLERKVEKQLNA